MRRLRRLLSWIGRIVVAVGRRLQQWAGETPPLPPPPAGPPEHWLAAIRAKAPWLLKDGRIASPTPPLGPGQSDSSARGQVHRDPHLAVRETPRPPSSARPGSARGWARSPQLIVSARRDELDRGENGVAPAVSVHRSPEFVSGSPVQPTEPSVAEPVSRSRPLPARPAGRVAGARPVVVSRRRIGLPIRSHDGPVGSEPEVGFSLGTPPALAATSLEPRRPNASVEQLRPKPTPEAGIDRPTIEAVGIAPSVEEARAVPPAAETDRWPQLPEVDPRSWQTEPIPLSLPGWSRQDRLTAEQAGSSWSERPS